MNNWKIGDLALHINDGGIRDVAALRMVGEECTILCPATIQGYDWDVDIRGMTFTCMESCLKPLPPPNEVTTWESMEDIFIPKEVVLI